MKVYISVDMEGIAGISHPGPTDRKDSGYPAAVDLMVGEANAAIEQERVDLLRAPPLARPVTKVREQQLDRLDAGARVALRERIRT